ncbi:MAG: hypothetical protein HKN43_14630 [Rhodothermales bacterium]|nr:hypothetical protein [Rhodothermales bacterium]
MRSLLFVSCMIMILSNATICLAQEFVTPNIMRAADSTDTEFSLDSLDWLAGSWRGNALGGIAEEVWSPPSGGTMLGMFKMIDAGETAFTEHMAIITSGRAIKMVLKHFNADMTGWEEKDEVESFEFVSADESAVYFDGLTIRRISDNQIAVFVLMSEADGQISELTFEYDRVQGG